MDQKLLKWLNISYTHVAADSSEVACSRRVMPKLKMQAGTSTKLAGHYKCSSL